MNPAPAELLQLLTNCSTSAIVAFATYLFTTAAPNHPSHPENEKAALPDSIRQCGFANSAMVLTAYFSGSASHF
jgi:hypothetical protein